MKVKKLLAGMMASATLLSMLTMPGVEDMIPEHLFSTMTVSAATTYQDATINHINYTLCTSGTSTYAMVRGCDTTVNTLNIPASVSYGGKSFAVTSIITSAFQNNTKLTHVYLQSATSLNSISNTAFSGCTSLVSVYLPAALRTLGAGAFKGDTALSEVNISSCAMSVLPSSAFESCYALRTIILPSNLTMIGLKAFYRCPALQSIQIPSKVRIIGQEAFTECYNLLRVTFMDATTGVSLGNCAFSGCSKMNAINLPSGTTTIPDFCFCGCNALVNFQMPVSVTNIGTSAFSRSGISGKVTMNKPSAYIGESAFYNCTNLSSVSILSQNVEIGNSAFSNCNVLKTVQVTNASATVTLKNYAFDGCAALSTVTLPAGTNAIPDYCFRNCTSLKSFAFPSSLKSIGISAFEESGLSGTINISNSITALGNRAFAYTKNISAFNVVSTNANFKSVNGVLYTKDGKNLLQYPAKKTSTSYSISDCMVKTGAIYNNTYLKQLTIGTNVTYAYDAIGALSNLEKAYIPSAEFNKGNNTIFKTYAFLFEGSKVNYINGYQIVQPAQNGQEPTFNSRFFAYMLDHFPEFTTASYMNIYLNHMSDYVIAKCITPNMTDLEKAVRLEKWVRDRVSYDPNSNYLENQQNHVTASIFLHTNHNGQHFTVCEGYARGYDLLLKRAGIQSYVIIGDPPKPGEQEGHAWNVIQIAGNLYHVDACWDDQNWAKPFDFFMKTDNVFNTDGHAEYQWLCHEKLTIRKENNVATRDTSRIGDVNNDGEFTSTDRTWLRQYLDGQRSLSTTAKYYADLNMDGIINETDYQLLCAGRGTYATYFAKIVHGFTGE